MKKQPKEITVCKLDCVLMPQGGVICNGEIIGWFKDLKPHLEPVLVQAELLDACEKAQFVYDFTISRMPTGSECKRLTKLNIRRLQAIAKAEA